MAVSVVKVLLDTNVIISAIGFGGKPRDMLALVLKNRIRAVTSPVLLAELEDVINKKFPLLTVEYKRINRLIRKKFKIVEPKKSLRILHDEPDNRVLEAATQGKCSYIITGDKELLKLGHFQKIKILSTDEFLLEIETFFVLS